MTDIAPLSLRLTPSRPDAQPMSVVGAAVYSAFADAILALDVGDAFDAEFLDHIAFARDGYGSDVLVDEEGDGVCLNFPAVTSAATEMTSDRARHWFLALFTHDRGFVDDAAAAGGWRVTIAEAVEADDDCPVCRALRPR